MAALLCVCVHMSAQTATESSTHSQFVPTSVAIDLSKKVARGLGYSLADQTKYFFDLMTDKNDKPAFAGYLTVGFYWNSNIVSAISINESTGQILDIDRCMIFEYPSLRSFQRDASRLSGVPPIPLDELSKQLGCDSIKRMTVPRKHP